MTTARNFAPITGVPASDEAIDAFAARRGIPALALTPPAPIQALTPTSATTRFTLNLPQYLAEELRIRAVKDRCATRFLFLKALRDAGFTIEDADMLVDGRKLR